MSRVLHIVPGLGDIVNGMSVVARLLAKEQGDAEVVDLRESLAALRRGPATGDFPQEVWVHGMWLPREWAACWKAWRRGAVLVRMTHACLDPVRLRYHGWKKRLVGPIERWCLRRCDRIVATCEAEKEWIEAYLGEGCPEIEVTDVKRFFDLSRVERVERVEERGVDCRVERVEGLTQRRRGAECAEDDGKPPSVDGGLHLLYLGRRHPLKGVEFLEEAVRQIQNTSASPRLRVRMVSSAFGEEKEKVWNWCDVLVLPTLSENFGLERGKRVITTDGAPAWGESLELRVGSGGVRSGIWFGYGGRLIYLKGYRDGTDEERVELLKKAIERLGE